MLSDARILLGVAQRLAELVAKTTPGKMAATTSSPDSDSGRAERLSPRTSPFPFPYRNMVLGSGYWALAFE